MSNLNPGGLTRVLNYIKTWVTGLLNGKANSSHTHTKSQITDFPTIPTVNNATLTIQKNSSNVATFTANASSNVTANITVPTKVSELSNDSGFITSSGSCNYANSAGAVAWNNVSGKPSSYTPSSHNHDSVYLKLSGGTITGNISKNNAATSWVQGRNAAPFRTIAASSPGDSQYVPCWSAKSYQGSWDCGPYTSNILHLSYITDANYNSGSNVQTADFTFATDGTFNAKVLKQNGTAVSLSGHTHTKSNITDFPTIPTKTSQLTNDSGYITGIAWDNVSGKPSTFTPSSHTHDDRYYTESEINTLLLSKVYPVGAIYISVNSVNPGTLFGGTWEKIKDKFLLSSGDTYSIGSTGGNSSTTLKIANLPSHNHTGTTGNESQGHTHSGTTGNPSANHTHTFSGTSSTNGGHTHNTWTESTGSHFHKSGHGWHNVAAGSDRQCLSNHMINSDDWSENITGYSGAHSHFVGMDSNGDHTHTYSGTTSGISANHTHDFTTGGISAHHTHSFTTSSVGSTEAFSNMPPYLTVNIWKRTA